MFSISKIDWTLLSNLMQIVALYYIELLSKYKTQTSSAYYIYYRSKRQNPFKLIALPSI